MMIDQHDLDCQNYGSVRTNQSLNSVSPACVRPKVIWVDTDKKPWSSGSMYRHIFLHNCVQLSRNCLLSCRLSFLQLAI